MMARRQKRRRFDRLSDFISVMTLLGLLAVAAAWFEQRNAITLDGPFRVVDGDSLSIGNKKLRLIGIDAPEYDQFCDGADGKYACGKAARDYLSELMARAANVGCRSSGNDKYDRLLVECSSAEISINAAMVSAGWAVAYGGFYEQERAARAAKIGLWAGHFDRPGDWRAKYGGLLESEHRSILRFIWQRISGWFNTGGERQ